MPDEFKNSVNLNFVLHLPLLFSLFASFFFSSFFQIRLIVPDNILFKFSFVLSSPALPPSLPSAFITPRFLFFMTYPDIIHIHTCIRHLQFFLTGTAYCLPNGPNPPDARNYNVQSYLFS
ncbi:hypothetical protein C8R48DRAFT_743545 [Suillus tomentosus]|nr:hypothetical protein C8R48DRAFT_743545 [Suillus tomentosus]